ncbi:MAG: PQQ-like beta-propeller repeat protein [candidate division KSB1 bacterium]|nr:PQQ-like beta-propeller repeat protein [candidate division KSB1 bacterium]MDZ7404365.1 PQQ-like beta-propeller repeat protein [candidate division KSB1 bacterium]
MQSGSLRYGFALVIAAFMMIGWNFNSSHLPAASAPDDWPQWRGPNRDGISKETGLLKSWPEGGPKVLWRVPSGEGYAGIVIAKGRGYTMYGQGGSEFVICFDPANGKELWRFKADALFGNDQGNGPRSTPVVDGDLVFALSGSGKLHALSAAEGKAAWSHDLRAEYGGKIPTWGVSTTPLVEGNLLIVDVGGKSGHSVMAFNKANGSVVWKSESDIPGYSAPIAITTNSVRQILVFTGSGLVSVAPNDGKLFWRHDWETRYDVNAATPVFIPPDKIFISSGYGKGGALLQTQAGNGRATVRELWRVRDMANHFSSSVLLNNHLYGFDEGLLTCLDLATGKTKWQQRGFQKGSLLLADGHLIVLGEYGNLALVEATPDGYKEKSSVQILKGKCWTMPTLANGRLYLRNQSEMLCLEVAGKN